MIRHLYNINTILVYNYKVFIVNPNYNFFIVNSNCPLKLSSIKYFTCHFTRVSHFNFEVPRILDFFNSML